MLIELFEYFGGYSRDICSQLCTLQNMDRMANGGRQYLRVERWILIKDCNDIGDQMNPIHSSVVESANKRRYKRCTSFGSQKGLVGGKTQRDVYHGSILG